MSRPLRFAFMKTSPSHRIRLKAKANARPLKANEAIRGSPSPLKVLTIMPIQAAESVRRLHASARERVVAMAIRKIAITENPDGMVPGSKEIRNNPNPSQVRA